MHVCAVALSAKAPGTVEQKLREEVSAFTPPAGIDTKVLKPGPDGKKQYSAKIVRLADELVGLTLLEAMDLTDMMKQKLGYTDRCVSSASGMVEFVLARLMILAPS